MHPQKGSLGLLPGLEGVTLDQPFARPSLTALERYMIVARMVWCPEPGYELSPRVVCSPRQSLQDASGRPIPSQKSLMLLRSREMVSTFLFVASDTAL